MAETMHLSKQRLEALTDGIFAIMLTLLVLEIRLPELHRSAPDEEILTAFRSVLQPLFGFAVSFIVPMWSMKAFALTLLLGLLVRRLQERFRGPTAIPEGANAR